MDSKTNSQKSIQIPEEFHDTDDIWDYVVIEQLYQESLRDPDEFWKAIANELVRLKIVSKTEEKL